MSSQLGLCAVTGGNGWLASQIVSKLTQMGCNVVSIDISDDIIAINETINPYCKIEKSLVKYIKCDIRNVHELSKALKDVKTVFHVCSITDIRMCPSDLLEDVNINGTKSVISGCINNNITNLVYTSSIDSVIEGDIKDQSTENYPWVYDYCVYGKTKAVCEELILNAGKNNNINVACLRLAHLYGPGDPIVFATVKIPLAIGDMKCKHSFIYIENCAHAHIKCAMNLYKNEVKSQIYNIKDLDYNFITFYRHNICQDYKTKIYYIPYNIALIIAIIYDYIVWILFKIFGIRIGDPIESFGKLAVQAVGQEHTWNVSKYNTLIGYDPPIKYQDTLTRTRLWLFKYKQHSQTKKR